MQRLCRVCGLRLRYRKNLYKIACVILFNDIGIDIMIISRYSRNLLVLSKCMILLSFLLQAFLPQSTLILAQRTDLDRKFAQIYRPLRLLGLQLTGRSGDDLQNVAYLRSLGKTQKLPGRRRSLWEFCDTKNGPGRRSAERPKSVHRLRPGDIDVVGAMGDSLTAGNGIFASNLLHVTVENRGVVWSIGGQDNWQKYLTLPNILKEFNPNLYGYSLRDGLATERSSKFNVAELGAMSRDISYEAKILVKRLQRDPLVNMTEDWKLVTLLIANNDFCSDVCFYQNPEITLKWHEENMLKTYRYLRDNVPRLMLNVVAPPNLRLLTRLKGLPARCHATLRLECPCLVGKGSAHLDRFEKLMKKWIAMDYEIAGRAEFIKETFTINVQSFTQFKDFPRNAKGDTDTSFLSEDCFHLSQKGQSVAANAYWNNLLEPDGEKTLLNPKLFDRFLCPTEEHPYIMTRINSRKDFQV